MAAITTSDSTRWGRDYPSLVRRERDHSSFARWGEANRPPRNPSAAIRPSCDDGGSGSAALPLWPFGHDKTRRDKVAPRKTQPNIGVLKHPTL